MLDKEIYASLTVKSREPVRMHFEPQLDRLQTCPTKYLLQRVDEDDEGELPGVIDSGAAHSGIIPRL